MHDAITPKLKNLIAKWNVIFAEIGDIAGVAEVTIKQSYKLMYPKAHALFPEDFVYHTPIAMLPPN